MTNMVIIEDKLGEVWGFVMRTQNTGTNSIEYRKAQLRTCNESGLRCLHFLLSLQEMFINFNSKDFSSIANVLL